MASASAGDYKDTLVEALHCFKCYKDPDVQGFLNNNAIEFEKKGVATTYLLLSQEAFNNNQIRIEGYFSLTHKAVIFAKEVSRTARKKLTGKKDATIRSFVLIGQLGKYICKNEDGSISCSSLSAKDLLDDAMGIIQQASDYIICRNVIIECKPIEKVKNIYQTYGFTDLQFDKKDGLHTLYLKLDNQIDF